MLKRLLVEPCSGKDPPSLVCHPSSIQHDERRLLSTRDRLGFYRETDGRFYITSVRRILVEKIYLIRYTFSAETRARTLSTWRLYHTLSQVVEPCGHTLYHRDKNMNCSPTTIGPGKPHLSLLDRISRSVCSLNVVAELGRALSRGYLRRPNRWIPSVCWWGKQNGWVCRGDIPRRTEGRTMNTSSS